MRKAVFLLLAASGLIRCNFSGQSRARDLQGVWRTDSISNFVNGLNFTNNTFDEHWSTFEYTADSLLIERKSQKHKNYRYRFVSADSLFYTDSTGNVLSRFQILHLNARQLVLKKHQKPYLPGKNQELYEIRFFSKIPADSLSISEAQ